MQRPIAGSPALGDSFQAHRSRKSVNPGQDYKVPVGTDVLSPADGYIAVDDDGPSGGAGISIVIYHDNGYSSDLLHLSRNLVLPGQRVTQGEIIGKSGNTGASTGPHLHWSLRDRKSASYNAIGNVDPELFLVNGSSVANQGILWDQQRLNVWAGHDKVALLVVDGIRGAKTVARVKDFQGKHGLKVDGIAGPQTDAALATNPPVPNPPKPSKPALSNPYGLADVRGLQKIAVKYGAQTKIDNVWGPESARGFTLFLQRNWNGSLSRWLRARYNYVGNDVYGPNMQAALARANTANFNAL